MKPTHRRRILLVKWAFLLVIFLPLIQDQAHEQFVSFPGSSPASFRQAASQATATSPPDSTNPTPTPTLIPPQTTPANMPIVIPAVVIVAIILGAWLVLSARRTSQD